MSIIINNNKIKKIYINNNNNNNLDIQKGYVGIESRAKLFYGDESNLPDGYIKIEYIEKINSNSYINTGISGIKPMKIEAGVSNIGSGFKEIFGFLTNESSPLTGAGYVSALYFNNQYLFYYYYDRSETTLNNNIYIEKNKFYNIEYDFDQNSHTFTFKESNNNSYKEKSINYNQKSYFINSEDPLLLFGYYNTSYKTINLLDSGLMIKKVKIYNNSQTKLLRNFIPCINPNYKIGLYDLVTKVFYENSGASSFGAGPIVQQQGEL